MQSANSVCRMARDEFGKELGQPIRGQNRILFQLVQLAGNFRTRENRAQGSAPLPCFRLLTDDRVEVRREFFIGGVDHHANSGRRRAEPLARFDNGRGFHLD